MTTFVLRQRSLPDEDCVECPHCDATLEVDDTRWWDEKLPYEDEAVKCPTCGKKFMLTVQYTMIVSARKKE